MKRMCRGLGIAIVLAVPAALAIDHLGSVGHQCSSLQSRSLVAECTAPVNPQSAASVREEHVPTLAPPLREATEGSAQQPSRTFPTQLVYIDVEADRPGIEVELCDLQAERLRQQ